MIEEVSTTQNSPRKKAVDVMDRNFFATLQGSAIMLTLAVIVMPRLTDDEKLELGVILAVGFVAVGQVLGVLLSSIVARFQRDAVTRSDQ